MKRINSAKGPVQQVSRRFVIQRYAQEKLLEIRSRQGPAARIVEGIFGKKVEMTSTDECIFKLGVVSQFCNSEIASAIVKFFGYLPRDIRFSADAFISGMKFQSLHSRRRRVCRNFTVMFKYMDHAEIVPEQRYASAIVFFQHGLNFYVACKKFDFLSSSIKHTVVPPTIESLLVLHRQYDYGSFFPVVRSTEQIAIVEFEDILSKAVVAPYFNDFVVTDLMPYEHN